MSGRHRVRAADRLGPRGGVGVLRVNAGTTVSWTWAGQNTHSVVGPFDGKDYNSGDHTRADGFTATHQFANAGTYEYVCGFHGGSMRGTVIVE